MSPLIARDWRLSWQAERLQDIEILLVYQLYIEPKPIKALSLHETTIYFQQINLS
jgi:hypothetical protein